METILGDILLAAFLIGGLLAAWDLTDYASISDILKELGINTKHKK